MILNQIRKTFGSGQSGKLSVARPVPLADYPDPALNREASEWEVNNWVVSDFVVQQLYPVVGVRPFPLQELMLMVSSVCHFKPTHIFEWGTHIGKSARIFYETTRTFSIPAQIHSIDLPDDVTHVEHPGSERGLLVKGLPGVHLHQGDGLGISLALCKQLKAERPLFFVDGDHAYESVKRELSGILNEIHAPAVLLHDTFYQSAPSGYNIGPCQAIRDVLRDYSGYRSLSTQMGLPGMTLVYKHSH